MSLPAGPAPAYRSPEGSTPDNLPRRLQTGPKVWFTRSIDT